MTRSLVFVLTLVVLSAPATADGYSYQARIDGMVCAFCAYNVGKTIGSLTGVDADSVRVDLDAHLVNFHGKGAVEWADVSAAFTDSGFVLAALDQVDYSATESKSTAGSPLFSLDFDSLDTERFEGIVEATGEIASAQGLRLVIEAPEALEPDLLKPLLMGKTHAISVRFVSINEASIRLKVYSASATSGQ